MTQKDLYTREWLHQNDNVYAVTLRDPNQQFPAYKIFRYKYDTNGNRVITVDVNGEGMLRFFGKYYFYVL